VTAPALVEWLRLIIAPLVAEPGALEVRQVGEAGPTVLLAIAAAERDVGKVIGASGCVIHALRALATAYGSRRRLRVALDVPQSRSSRLGP
jgi:predicted RNA-binding protein YlqC (UPF0109 family)